MISFVIPTYLDDTLRQRDRYAAERLIDLEVVAALQVHPMFQNEVIKLMTYRDLTAADMP